MVRGPAFETVAFGRNNQKIQLFIRLCHPHQPFTNNSGYVLRSKSDHPMVAAHRELVHKIGVTGNGVKQRIAGASLQPTFLLADVEVVATYELFNINRSKLEHLIHRIFDPARFDVEIIDRFGRPYVPKEWFMVPLFVIAEAVDRIRDGTIVGYRYDPASATLVEREEKTGHVK
ncbi:hypothetical protein CCR83_05480 [Rhodobacter veldkampii DSM 11550]|nr:hypothetical protein [Phaeovulum veldkampii DSM 11550]